LLLLFPLKASVVASTITPEPARTFVHDDRAEEEPRCFDDEDDDDAAAGRRRLCSSACIFVCCVDIDKLFFSKARFKNERVSLSNTRIVSKREV